MAECLIDSVRNGKRYSIFDYIDAYDNDVAFEEVEYLSTSLITEIPTDDFFRRFKKLKYVNLPNLIDLPPYAFSGCSTLEEVIFPKISILSNAGIFMNCYNLSAVTFSTNVLLRSTAQSIFARCSNLYNLTNIFCNDYVPSYAFENCWSLTNITISGNCSTIGYMAFSNCINLTNINASKIQTIEGQAFMSCSKLIVLNLGTSLSSIGNYAFYSCIQLSNINNVIKNISSIGGYAFYGCNINELSINGDPYIGGSAFDKCSNLSKIYAPNLTKLLGLPYVKDITLGSVISIYQILSNSYFNPVMELSTVEYVRSNAGLSQFKIIKLENCYSYCVIGNIGGSILEEFDLPKWSWNDPHFSESTNNTWSVYGFAGYRTGYYNPTYRYYGNLHLSKLFLMYNKNIDPYNRDIMNPVNFPAFSINDTPTPSTIALYSCIEYLGIYSFYAFTSRWTGVSPKKHPLINYFSKLKAVTTTNFYASIDYLYTITNDGKIDYGSLQSIYFIPNESNNASLNITQASVDIMPSRLDIYANNISNFHMSINGDFNVNLDNVYNLSKLTLNICNNSHISKIRFNNIKFIELFATGYNTSYNCMESLPNLSEVRFNDVEILKGSDIYVNTGAGPFYNLSNLSNIYMSKLKYIDDFCGYAGDQGLHGIFQSCGHISELYLPELIGYSTDFSVSESNYRGFRIPDTIFDIVTLGISSICSHNAYMFNTEILSLPKCSNINIITGGYSNSIYYTRQGYSSNIKSIYAPLCNIFYTDIGSTTERRLSYSPLDFKIERITLSEYVDDFKFIGLPRLSMVSVKTSSSYNMSTPIFGMCYSLKDIYIQAANNISINTANKVGDYVSLWYPNLPYYYENINNISIIANGNISIVHNPFTYGTGGNTKITYMTISANSVYLSSNGFPITTMLSIKAENLEIHGTLMTYVNPIYLPRSNGLIILDTPTYISEPFFAIPSYSSQYRSLINCIIKVRASLLSLYQANSNWKSFPNIGFIEI